MTGQDKFKFDVETEGHDDLRADQGPPRWRSTRFCLAYMVATGLMVVFLQRVSFSMAIVCMVNHTAIKTHHHHNHNHNNKDAALNTSLFNVSQVETYDPRSYDHDQVTTNTSVAQLAQSEECQRSTAGDTSKEDGPFPWDKSLQGLLLGALYWGYMVSLVPASYIVQRRGFRLVIGFSIVAMSLLHVLCHPAAFLSPWAVFALRVCIGLCSGLSIPGMYSVWGRWAPVAERAQLLSMAFAGQMIANASVFPASALLCQYGFWGGWPAIFYVFGAVGLLWSFLWFIVISDTPENHSRICPKERDYIINTRSAMDAHKEKITVPWRAILTAPCFWAIAVSQFTYNWGFTLMLSNLPIFLHEAMNFDIQSNGVYSMLPYIFLFVTMGGAGFLSDFVVRRRFLSVIGARRFFTIIGYMTPAVLLVVMSHQHCSQVVVVVLLLVLSVGTTGLANTAGFFVNPYDIAPRFATSICTASSTLAIAAGIMTPYVVAYVTVDETKEQWQVVFYIMAAMFTFGTVFFCVFARGEVQPWGTMLAVETTMVEAGDADGDAEKKCDVILEERQTVI
ncbi:putative transporter slc-17.2 [Babylonia areolata]|uniref:putative transporter slc-17.2 n=1 Tax=Babylonia areolata TaxID=304850 RepID=UPI003FD2331A